MSNTADIVQSLSLEGKGIMACDESLRSMGKRFETAGITPTPEARKRYLSMLFGAAGLEQSISGVILYDDVLSGDPDMNSLLDCLVKKGITIGVRADRGVAPFPGNSNCGFTVGTDDLTKRLIQYKNRGAKFVKWRAAFDASDESKQGKAAASINVTSLALFALTALEHGLVPIVEVEVEMDGGHGLSRCRVATERALSVVFKKMIEFNVQLDHIILKTNFLVPGKDSRENFDIEKSASETVKSFTTYVPSSVPLIAFLSGGMSSDRAIGLLRCFSSETVQWRSTFSFGRALWIDPLKIWSGDDRRIHEAQTALISAAELSAKATNNNCT